MDVKPDDQPEDLGPCPLCGRPMIKGASVDRHHWQPKSRGGKEVEYLHRICHRKLHSLYSSKKLAAEVNTPEKARQHPEMQAFIKWVRRQPPERVVRHSKPRSRLNEAGACHPSKGFPS